MVVINRSTNTTATDNREAPPAPLIHVVEDETALHALFHSMGHMAGYEIATYTTVEAFFATFDDKRVGCIVLDLNLPDGTGIEILQKLSDQHCSMPVVFMSGMATVSEAVEAFRLGTLDFVEKPFGIKTMLDAMRRGIETDVANREAEACFEHIEKRFGRLSPRENEVMEFVVRGSANKNIAAKLGLSPKTVEVHRANVMRKSEATSIAHLVRMHVTLNAHA
jgi:two-component system response regulator FixJ